MDTEKIIEELEPVYDAHGDRVRPGDTVWSYGLKGRVGHFKVTEILPRRQVKGVRLLAGNYLIGEAVELDAATMEREWTSWTRR